MEALLARLVGGVRRRSGRRLLVLAEHTQAELALRTLDYQAVSARARVDSLPGTGHGSACYTHACGRAPDEASAREVEPHGFDQAERASRVGKAEASLTANCASCVSDGTRRHSILNRVRLVRHLDLSRHRRRHVATAASFDGSDSCEPSDFAVTEPAREEKAGSRHCRVRNGSHFATARR